MRLRFQSAYKSIPTSPEEIDLPALTVLSGPNGSGKTHLLRAIRESHVLATPTDRSEGPYDHLREDIRLVPFGSLRAVTRGTTVDRVSERLRRALADLTSSSYYVTTRPIGIESARRLVAQRVLTGPAIERMKVQAGKPLEELTLNEIVKLAPPLMTLDPLAGAITEVFESYAARRDANEFKEWQASKGRTTDGLFVPDEEFESLFGPPPWEVLTEVMESMGLEFEFRKLDRSNPSGQEGATAFDQRTGEQRPVDDLSTGEQTLLALALISYAGTDGGGLGLALPRMVLLDEPDAGLHPTMVGHMLRIIQEVLVEVQGVDVALTTHSPTTVALAPEESLYTIDRTRTPLLANEPKDQCLQRLTVGLPTLSVRMDRRRQVFCEGQDARLYESLYEVVTRTRSWPFGLQFIPVPEPGNRSSVESIVTALRREGVPSVFGIVDRDARGPETPGVFTDPTVYAIENLLLNPVSIGLYLLREQIVPTSDLGLDRYAQHFALETDELQALCTAVSARLSSTDEVQDRGLALAGGAHVLIHPSWAERQGHTLEAQLLEVFPSLKATKGQLKHKVIGKVLNEQPQYVPQSLIATFEAMSTPTD